MGTWNNNWNNNQNNNWNNNGNHNPNRRMKNGHPAYSGCQEKNGKNKKAVIFGWRKTKGGLFTFVASQNNGEHAHAKGGKVIKNKKGEEYTRWTATITNKTQMTESTVSCLYNHATGKLYFPSLNLTANPKAPNGGCWVRTVQK